MNKPTTPDLKKLNFDKFKPYTEGMPEGYDWLYGEPGQEHYRLLAWYSTQYEDGTIFCDLGTYRGLSALSLSYNEKCKVKSYDIKNFCHINIRRRENIEFRIQNCINDIDNIIKSPLLFLDIDPHDGVQEKRFLELLIEKEYKGMMLVDDINASNVGTAEWWRSITLPKEDVSELGHKTGTGIIYFK